MDGHERAAKYWLHGGEAFVKTVMREWDLSEAEAFAWIDILNLEVRVSQFTRKKNRADNKLSAAVGELLDLLLDRAFERRERRRKHHEKRKTDTTRSKPNARK